ncbi:hypothetical protein AMS68_000565 [Peltaster fructicola]|uniref:Uncharacterized protein n=1 Tax=Peltaster fructicola TaxID=286661 RepID=A0A6H0XK91_9PEZI|nr:hypothetical protein AMS68_000565 [Peltaster fructicola]
MTESLSNAKALGQLLAQGLAGSQKFDVLYNLSVEQGQWKAAVWIAQRLLETSQSDTLLGDNLEQLVEQSHSLLSLKSMTGRPINHSPTSADEPSLPVKIDALIGSRLRQPHHIADDHHVLGCIWRSLGLMTLACVRDPSIANGFVKPEILEILALFHHHGFMPASVYTYIPSDQPDAVQQPATLHLLSQRIMVALSDAAWRGRESTALASSSADISSTRLERLGSAVRANIEAVKPEMWLELILWSCLHGGWHEPGIDVMLAVCRETSPSWTSMSWRKNLRDHLGVDRTEDVDWVELITEIGVRRKSSYDPDLIQVERTLSSELVNAYVDVLTGLNVSVQGVPAGRILRHLETFRNFLRRTGLNLHGGTWDSTILRLIENDATLVNRTDMMNEFVRLSPTMGEELASRDEQAKPSYVLDGNAALLGLLHRALQVQIDAGSLVGALRIFKLIRRRVDDAKQRSIEDFFRSRLLDDDDVNPRRAKKNGLFTSNFPGVEHPTFEHQIPLTTMGALIDLITQLGAHELGTALVNEGDLDGYLLDKRHFGHPQIAPALIRFATATNDDGLVARVVQARNVFIAGEESRMLHSDTIMSSILSELFVTKQWQTARQVLDHVHDNSKLQYNAQCLAVLGAKILQMLPQGSSNDDVQQAWKLFLSLTMGDFAPVMPRQRALANKQRDIIGVLSTVRAEFATLAESLVRQAYITSPDVYSFNFILDAVAMTQGSKAAQNLLNAFTPESERSEAAPHRAPRFSRQQSMRSFLVPDINGRQLTVRDPLKHNLTSFIIVLKKGLQEYVERHQQRPIAALDAEAQDLLQWVVRGLLGPEGIAQDAEIREVHDEVLRLLEELDMASVELDMATMLT